MRVEQLSSGVNVRHSFHISSADVGCVAPSVVKAGMAGVGVGSLLPGACISPPNASIELEITIMVPRKKHRIVCIGLDPF